MRVTKTVFLLLPLLLAVAATGTACGQTPMGNPVVEVMIGLDEPFECPQGTFCLKDIFLTEEIRAGDQVYRSETAYLVVRAEFDFESYSLRECGVTVYNYDDHNEGSLYYRINYFRTERGRWSNEIGGSEDLDLPLTEALSTDLHLDGEPGPVRGTAWLCFRVPSEIKNYLYEQVGKGADMTWAEQFKCDVRLHLNDVYYPNPYSANTVIGCRFDQIEICETYPIEA